MPSGTRIAADLAIIGAGPAGLTLARELAGTKTRILVLESGGETFEQGVQALNRVENVGDPGKRNAMALPRGYTGELSWLNEVPPFELRNRVVGGSSHTWIGKCAAFDEIDFTARNWAPGSGWPMTRRELAGALDRAAAMLNLGPNLYDHSLHRHLRSPPADLGINGDLLRTFFWQFSHGKGRRGEPLRFAELAREMSQDMSQDMGAANIDVLTHATVTRLDLDDAGRRITSLEARTLDGVRATIEAKITVLCCGGIENARLLLASNTVCKSGIGNERDVVGRYLADHPRTVIARFDKKRSAEVAEHFGFYGLMHDRAAHFYLRGLSLSPRLQRREGLLNCAAYPVQMLSAGDPWLALKRLYAKGTRQRWHDVRTVLSAPDMFVSGLRRRLLLKRGLPRKVDEIRFDAMVEQRPNPDSRITLSSRRDRLDMPVARIDWKIGWAEIASVARLAELMSAEFWRIGLPQPQMESWVLDEDFDHAPFSDMAHPACTTRMGSDPATSVVDPDGRVHGMEGLYIAGSSVFPTCGHANPTLMIVAMTIRLADHLKTVLRRSG